MSRYFHGWWLVLLALSARAQGNLIPNPGFEDHISCPSHLSEFNGVIKDWFTPTTGTPNFYHACAASPEVGVPQNYFGHKAAYKGSGYVGIMTSNAFREYITVQLSSTLIKGRRYHLSFYTSIIRQNRCKSNGLDVLLSANAPAADLTGENLHIPPSLHGMVDYPDEKWQYSEFCYTAVGGEKYLTFGDFTFPDAHHDCLDGDISYYFMDEVSLTAVEDPSTIEVQYPVCDKSFPFVLDGTDIVQNQTLIDTTSWLWDGVINNSSRLIEKEGFYKLVFDRTNCVRSEYNINIKDSNCSYSLFLPNIFTPNNDGYNDDFSMHSTGVAFNKISIFNRIGQVVFESNDPNFRWDGQLHRKDLSDGVYVYLITGQAISSGRIIQKSGSVTLIR